MVRVFGHHISLRAVLFAIVEIAAFITFFNISRALALYLVEGNYQGEIIGQTFLLPLFCVIAFATASACGLYNREIRSDPNRIVMRLATVAVLMYFLMAASISLAEVFLVEGIDLKLYYAITLAAAVGFFFTSLLFRHNAFAYNFNGTSLEQRILVIGVDECAAKIEYLNGTSRSPYQAVEIRPIVWSGRASNIRDPTEVSMLKEKISAASAMGISA